MKPEIDSYSLDPANPSGRDVWWDVNNGIVRRIAYSMHQVGLEGFIVARAEQGCLDCISAILECPNDHWITEAIEDAKENAHG